MKAVTPGYDEYRYDLGMIGHDPHELAAFLSAVLQGYTRQSAQAELARVFAAQYQLTLTGGSGDSLTATDDLNRPGDRRDHLRRSSL